MEKGIKIMITSPLKTHHLQLHASPRAPQKTMLYLNHQLAVPRSMSIDGMLCYGGGTGVGLDLIRKAFGEYHEREHFFLDVPLSQRGSIEAVVPRALREKYSLLLSQLSKNEITKDSVLSYSKVTSLKDEKAVPYFYNALALKSDARDTALLPFSDSSACATHNSKQASFDNALSEFIERQAFLGSWMAQRANYRIAPEVLLRVTPFTQLVEDLLSGGELYIFHNALDLPGHSVVMFYFSKDKRDKVQYTVGASAGFSLPAVLTSALEELWQCYAFLYNVGNTATLKDKAGSSFHRKFEAYNNTSTKGIIPYFKEGALLDNTIANYEDVKSAKVYTAQDIIDEFNKRNNDVFYYHKIDTAKKLHFTKIVSPDYFVHMALDEPLNIINAYSQRLGITTKNAYTTRLPFP